MSTQTMSHALVANSLPTLNPLGSLDAYIGAVHQIPVLSVEDEQALAQHASWCIRTCASSCTWPVATTATACRWAI
jgi:hypothetical protein